MRAKANAELDDLATRIGACESVDGCAVIGSGDALADIFLLKSAPDAAERSGGVAFRGASGDAITRAADRLGIPRGVLYGTNAVKCASHCAECADRCRGYLAEELAIVQPCLVFAMGEAAFSAACEVLGLGAAYEAGACARRAGRPTVIGTVDLDQGMADESLKKLLWRDLQRLGSEYARQRSPQG